VTKILVPATSPEDWKQFLAEPEKQWKSGYSARSLAYCWQEAGGIPPEIISVLGQVPSLKGLKTIFAIPEHKVALPGGVRVSQNDVWVLGESSSGLVSIAVEGEVSEPFGPTVEEWFENKTAGKAHGFLYLIAIMDWYSRKLLPWRLSNTLDIAFCVDALEEALQLHGNPEIFNTDQGCQFTSDTFTKILKGAGVSISMDGKGRWTDNVFIERLWRSLKYEEVYLKAYDSMAEAKLSIGTWFRFYNQERRHQSLNRNRPDEIFYGEFELPMAA